MAERLIRGGGSGPWPGAGPMGGASSCWAGSWALPAGAGGLEGRQVFPAPPTLRSGKSSACAAHPWGSPGAIPLPQEKKPALPETLRTQTPR